MVKIQIYSNIGNRPTWPTTWGADILCGPFHSAVDPWLCFLPPVMSSTKELSHGECGGARQKIARIGRKTGRIRRLSVLARLRALPKQGNRMSQKISYWMRAELEHICFHPY
jgi:hypothetical protein